MYTPQLSEPIIRLLYRLARHRTQPMTRVTDELLLSALEQADLPEDCHELLDEAKRALRPSLCVLEAA